MHLLHFDVVVAVAVASFVRSLNIPEIACKWQNHSFTWIKYDCQKVYQTKLNFEKTVRLTGHLRSVSVFFKVVLPFLFCCYYLYFFLHFFWGVIVLFFIHFSGGSHCLNFDKFWDTVPPQDGGGGYSWEFVVGVCRPVLQVLTLFQTPKLTFSTLILRPGP